MGHVQTRSAIMGHVGNEQQKGTTMAVTYEQAKTERNEIMQYGVSMKEYTEDGKRYIKVNELVCEVDDSIDRGCLLFDLLYCTPFYFMKCFI